jgi:hypothetical protein
MKILLLTMALALSSCVTPPEPEPSVVAEEPEPIVVMEKAAPAVIIPNHINFARGAAISASSTSSKWEGERPVSAVADGDPSTRWASLIADSQQLTFDFAEPRNVRRLRILWEAASAAEFAIQMSDDGETWRKVAEQAGGQKGPRADEISFEPASGRWLRLDLQKRATEYGYSIYEVEIY